MKIEKTLLENHQIQLNVEVDDETFEKSKRKAAKKISSRSKVPGFRPGKAPYNVILRQYGEAAVVEEALEFLVDDIYPQLIEKEEITPYGPGQLKQVKSLSPPELEFVIPLAPKVTLGEYQAIRLDFEVPPVTEENVDQTMENLLARQAKTEPVERPAAAGDMMYIMLHGHEKDDEEENLVVDLHHTPVVIEADDADTDREWPFPGFSNGLKGLEKGAQTEFSHEYAEDYDQDDNLKGKSVIFRVVVEEVRSYGLPELNDEFVKSLGAYETVEDLRSDARVQLEVTGRDNYETDYQNRLLDQIVEEAEFLFPPQMVDDEIDALVDQFKNRLSNEGWDLENYLKVNQKEETELREEFRESAERRIRRGLAIMEISEKEAIKVDENDVQAEVQRTVDMVNTSFSPVESKKILNPDFLRGLASSAMRDALTELTFARLKAIAKGELDLTEESDAAPKKAAPKKAAPKKPAAKKTTAAKKPAAAKKPKAPKAADVEVTKAEADAPVAEAAPAAEETPQVDSSGEDE